jgi:hypothetical protein
MRRDALSWLWRPGWTRRPGRNPVLFAGPWVGEFGWELMNWQGWVRALAPHYEKVIVCARESSRALYADVATEFLPHTLRGCADHVVLRGVENPGERERVLARLEPEMDHLRPRMFVPASAQRFIRFGRPPAVPGVDVLIHARGKVTARDRNWSPGSWERLVSELRAMGHRVGGVGLPGDALEIDGVEDFRGLPLQETMDLMAGARLVIGPSSGPMHLASLCGTPHLVWTNRGIYRMGKTSREKYESWWNPLGTPVRVLDDEGFGVEPQKVLEQVRAFLSRLS